MRLGAKNNFEECMKMEFRMVSKVMNDHDFYEGVRALIIDKDNQPNWMPAKIEDVEDIWNDIEQALAAAADLLTTRA